MAQVATVHVECETDTRTGWTFDVRVLAEGGAVSTHTLRMAWVDYELWAGGRLRPSDVAEAVVRFAVSRAGAPDARLADFDASMLRRWFPGADAAIAGDLAGRGGPTDD